MLKEIGSDFWLDRFQTPLEKNIDLKAFGFAYSDMALFSSGRMAIAYVLDHIGEQKGKKKVLLPSYTCSTVIEPFLIAGYDIFFFDIDRKLEYNSEEFQNAVLLYNPSVILVHGYFGFNSLFNLEISISDLRANGIIVIEDVTQTLYSEFRHLDVDYYIGSLRKWAPLVDGGFALSTDGVFGDKPEQADLKLREVRLQALHMKYLYMIGNSDDKECFLKLFKQTEEMFSEQSLFFAMSDKSRRVQANLDLDMLRTKRRNNFQTLLDTIKGMHTIEPVHGYLPQDVTPLYFPVYVKTDRAALQAFLAKQNIYCPIIWPKPRQIIDNTDETVNWVYKRILAIPCDQRYGFDEMERIGKVIMNFGKGY